MAIRHSLFSLVVAAVFYLLSCSPPPGPHQIVHQQPITTSQSVKTVGFDQVKPVFAQHCAACHPSRSSPDWLDYSQAKVYADNGLLLRNAVIDQLMPPPGTPQAASISKADRDLIAAWIRDGAPEVSQDSSQAGSSAEPSPLSAPLTATEQTAQSCLSCHGVHTPDAQPQPHIPHLGGQSSEYIAWQLQQFKWLQRIDPTHEMNRIAASLSDEKIERLAEHFSHFKADSKAPATLTPERQKLFEAGKALARQSCNSCHANADFSFGPTSNLVPVLIGQSERYLMNQLLYFRNSLRISGVMNEFAKNLKNQEIEALAVYFANTRDNQSVKELKSTTQ